MSERAWLRDDDDDSCHECYGEGGFHDCGEDTCCCLDKDEITDICQTCHGTGYLRATPAPTQKET